MPGGIGQVRALALPVTAIRDAMLRQRGHLFVWVPVCLGVGIGTYFALPVEPGIRAAGAAVVGAAALCGLLALAGEAWRPLVAALLLALIGLTLAAARSQSVAAPVLGWRFYGPIEGRRTRTTVAASATDRIDSARRSNSTATSMTATMTKARSVGIARPASAR